MAKQTQPKAKAPEGSATAAQPAEKKAAQNRSAAETAAPAVEKPHEAKPPRLSASLKAQADRMIAKRGRGKTPAAPRPPKAKDDGEDLVVFAFRLSAEERELIHKAAGPARASRFVRALAVAAACHDMGAVKLLLDSTRQATA